MHALGEKLGGIRRPLDILAVEPRNGSERQVIKQPEATAHRHERTLACKHYRRERIGHVGPTGAVDRRVLDARRGLQAQAAAHGQLLEPERGNALRLCRLE